MGLSTTMMVDSEFCVSSLPLLQCALVTFTGAPRDASDSEANTGANAGITP